ncbi:uncharacterized protein LOC114721592 [Neltuma alba]|uniref:uncharacterized protein LOC114721592 n=1 Tax=Neltuma alba TaxID=207710 RepID=UPI0010A50AD6|nr:uncharacterized protein LOC114721592 [Prosopis alba]
MAHEGSGWEPPREGCVKFNVRGYFDASRDTRSCGGIARNHNGKIVARFMYRPPAGSSSLTTELWAILWALKVARDLDLKEVEVECECTEAVKATGEGVDGNQPDVDVVNDIMNRLKSDGWEVEVKECNRDQNKAADALAQYASSMVTNLHVIYERGQSSATTQQQESGDE